MDVGVHLANVVEVTMGHAALLGTFQLLVQQHVQLEVGLQKGEPPIAESFEGTLVANPVDPIEVSDKRSKWVLL